MSMLAADNSDYSIGRPITGDAVISDLQLTGWGNVLASFSQGGVIFWSVSTGNALTLYSDDARANSVCTGTIASNDRVTLTGATVSGSATVVHTAGTASSGRIVVAYGDEPDLEDVLQDSADYLDGSSQWRGVARFEKAFRISKREIDGWLTAALRGILPMDSVSRRIDLAVITNPYVLRTVHGMMAASIIKRRLGSLDPQALEDANTMRKQAKALFDSVWHELTYDETLTVDARRGSGVVTVGRSG